MEVVPTPPSTTALLRAALLRALARGRPLRPPPQQHAFHLLWLWLARPQGCRLPHEECYTTYFDPNEIGFYSGCATQAPRGTNPWSSHAPDRGGRPERPRHGVWYVLVHGSKATVLFDSSATCSYVSTKFAEHNLPITPQRVPIDTSSPLGNIRCTKRCQGVNITIEGHPFLADLTLLPSDGLDAILGMD